MEPGYKYQFSRIGDQAIFQSKKALETFKKQISKAELLGLQLSIKE
jgi:hypothetical protein